MNREDIEKAVAIMQAYADGDEIEYIVPYSITIPSDLSNALKQYAKDCGIPPNQAACEILRAALNRKDTKS